MTAQTPLSTPPSPPSPAAATTPPSRASNLTARHAAQTRLFGAMVAVSLVLHLGAFAAWAFFPARTRRAVDLDEAVVKARLVKLGKPRDEKLLPRLPLSPPPKTVDTKGPPRLEQPDKSKPEPQAPKEKAADILERFKSENATKDLNDLIRNRIGEESDEGQAFGDKDGTALDGEITQSYFARVTARIQKAMEVSSVLTDEERVRLKAVLCMSIGEDGTVSDITVKSSGSAVFDADVTAAAKRASPVPAPPPPARARAAEGVCFNFCPTTCN